MSQGRGKSPRMSADTALRTATSQMWSGISKVPETCMFQAYSATASSGGRVLLPRRLQTLPATKRNG
ncbi:hypothetical protein D3C84_358540 [compost metagenome]